MPYFFSAGACICSHFCRENHACDTFNGTQPVTFLFWCLQHNKVEVSSLEKVSNAQIWSYAYDERVLRMGFGSAILTGMYCNKLQKPICHTMQPGGT